MNGRRPRARGDTSAGQATVELAVAFPVVALVLLLIVQVGLVVRDQVLVVHAAREAARAAAVLPVGDTSGAQAAAARAGPLAAGRLETNVTDGRGPPALVTVRVTYRCRTEVPMVGALVPDVTLEATAVMRRG